MSPASFSGTPTDALAALAQVTQNALAL
jgi:hypothetical protein